MCLLEAEPGWSIKQRFKHTGPFTCRTNLPDRLNPWERARQDVLSRQCKHIWHAFRHIARTSSNTRFQQNLVVLYYCGGHQHHILTGRGMTSAHPIEPPAWHDREHTPTRKDAFPGELSSKLTEMLKPTSGRPIRPTSGSIRGAKMASRGENITSIIPAIRSSIKPVPERCAAWGVRFVLVKHRGVSTEAP